MDDEKLRKQIGGNIAAYRKNAGLHLVNTNKKSAQCNRHLLLIAIYISRSEKKHIKIGEIISPEFN